MPLDPQAAAILRTRANDPPLSTQTAAQVRAAAEARSSGQGGPDVARCYDLRIPGPAGEIPIRIYVPFGNGPHPCLVWYHGGGWVFGTLDRADATCRRLCAGSGCVVVSVDYRLAPEHKFPAAVEDSYAAALWVHGHAASLRVDARRIAVGGTSAGGNLAAVVCLMAKEKDDQPPLAFQLLVYPVTGADFNTPSHQQNGQGYELTRDSMVWFYKQYLLSPQDARSPYVAPLLARDTRDLPPAFVLTAEYDPLRDEGEAYAKCLRDVGVHAPCTRYDGMIHGFFDMYDALDKAKVAMSDACQALREALAR